MELGQHVSEARWEALVFTVQINSGFGAEYDEIQIYRLDRRSIYRHPAAFSRS
jgi:hypothetical protein